MTQKDIAIDAAKGVLILLIVLGHNTIVLQNADGLRMWLYNWHVYAFFLIASMLPIRSFGVGDFFDRLTRYYVPFLVFFAATTVLVLIVEGFGTRLYGVKSFVMGAFVGSAYWTEQANGARYFWFLPALCGLTLLRFVAYWIRPGGLQIWGIVLAFTMFLSAGFVPNQVLNTVPIGLPIAAYLFFPCLLFAHLWERQNALFLSRPISAALAVTSLALVANVLAFLNGSSLILAQLKVYTFLQPVELILHAAIPILNTTALILLLRLAPKKQVLTFFGNHSLVMFLSHQVFFIAFVDAATALGVAHSLGFGLVVFIVVIFFATASAEIIARTPFLRSVLTPHSRADWLSAFSRIRPSQSVSDG